MVLSYIYSWLYPEINFEKKDDYDKVMDELVDTYTLKQRSFIALKLNKPSLIKAARVIKIHYRPRKCIDHQLASEIKYYIRPPRNYPRRYNKRQRTKQKMKNKTKQNRALRRYREIVQPHQFLRN